MPVILKWFLAFVLMSPLFAVFVSILIRALARRQYRSIF